jgi:RNA-binding protein 26
MSPPLGPQNGSRKRSWNERGEGDAQDRNYMQGGDPNGRLYKQPRRGGPGGMMGRGGFEYYSPAANGRGGFQGRPPPMNLQGMPQQGFPNVPGMPSPPPGMPPFDPNNPMGAILAMQAMGFPVSGMPTFPQATSPGNKGPPGPATQPKKQRCRDYDLKGFCALGNTCMFEHGQDSIYVPPRNKGDEYDPSNSSLMTGIESNNGNPIANSFSNFRGSERGRGRGGMQRGGQYTSNTSRRGGRAEFSSDRPNFDRSKTTIVVENIPEEKFSEDEVRAFFSEFGNILEVSMRPYKRLAIVKFDTWDTAKAAYSSPKVIFDNRFVKVYWYTDQDSLPQPPAVATSNGSAKNGSVPSTPVAARATEAPQIDIEEFTRKQQEVQKVHEEKMRKKAEMETARKELEKRQEELLKSQAEEKKKLMEKIAAKTGKSSTPPSGSQTGTPAPSDAKSAQTEALKKQLAALEAEAQSLGLDTSLSDDTSWTARGRGRGRAGFRGRGTFVPRGFRGGYRGHSGAPFGGAGGGYKLDNRTKKVALTGIDFSDAEKDESLRQYLLVSFIVSRSFEILLMHNRASASTPTSK